MVDQHVLIADVNALRWRCDSLQRATVGASSLPPALAPARSQMHPSAPPLRGGFVRKDLSTVQYLRGGTPIAYSYRPPPRRKHPTMPPHRNEW